jgi:hypothetical protein
MSQRRKGFRRRGEFEKPKRFVVIAMEGAETEPRYFAEFRTAREAEIQIKLVNNPNHESRPREVLDRLTRCFNTNYNRKTDEGWIVIDRDAWPEDELNEVHREAKAAGFEAAVSNPCFELWLYLHFRDSKPFVDRHACQRELSEVLPGYSPNSKGNYDVSRIMAGLDGAMERARNGDLEAPTTWPRQQATRVYKLVERLLEPKGTANGRQ